MPRLWTIAAALSAVVVWPATAPATDAITKAEVRSEPPQTTHKRVRDLFWSLLKRPDLRRRTQPRASLRGLQYDTPVRGTEVPGLCRYDTLAIEFAPVDRGRRNGETPVRPVGFTAGSHYHFLRLPEQDQENDYKALPTEGPCRSVDPDKAGFFNADSEEDARRGMLAFVNLQQALRGKAPIPLECELYPNDKMTCDTMILSFEPEHIGSIEACAGENWTCFLVDIDDREIRIALDKDGRRVASAKLVSFIIIADTLID